MERFNTFTRDINDIRNRARNSQLTRKQRKEEERIKRENDMTVEPSRPQQQFNVGLSHTQAALENLTLRNWGLLSAPQANRNGNNGGTTSGQNSPQDLLGDSIADQVFFGRRRRAIDLYPQPPEPGARRATASWRLEPEPAPRPRRFELQSSSSPDSDAAEAARTEANRVQKEELDKREKELKGREIRLNSKESVLKARDRALDVRERQLNERDRNLFQREQRVAQREQNETRIGETRQQQLTEMEAMIARHREEMSRT